MHERKIKQKPQQSVALLSKEQKATEGMAPGQKQVRDEAWVSGPLLLPDACVGLGKPIISVSEFPRLQNNILTPGSRTLFCSVQSLWLILLKLISCTSVSSARGEKDREREGHGLETEPGPPAC